MMMCVSVGGGREGGCVCLYHKQRMGEPIQTEIEAGVDVDSGMVVSVCCFLLLLC